MDWIIKYNNGVLNNTTWDLSNKSNIERIYFEDNKNCYGMLMDGKFFINNIVYNLKVNLDNFEMIPFQLKTMLMTFTPDYIDRNINAWHIGYTLENDTHFFEYKMTIMWNREIYLLATEKNKNGQIINQKKVKVK